MKTSSRPIESLDSLDTRAFDHSHSPSSAPANERQPAVLTVAFVLLPEFTLYTFAGFIDALRIAADVADGSRQIHCRWTILGPDRTPVRSSCGVEVTPWELLRDPAEFDYIVVVGGLMKGHRKTDRRILDYLRLADQRGRPLIGICTGSFALARANLLNERRCCVHWAHRKEFAEEFPHVRVESDSVYVIDGNRITCAGGQSAIDVAALLVARHCGRSIARKLTVSMVLDSTRGPNHPQPHLEAKWFFKIDDPLVKRAILLMEQSAHHPVSTREIAASLGVSGSKLERAFQTVLGTSPARFFRILRIAHGDWEVRHTQKPIAWIASDLGFYDATHFSRLYHRYYGLPPGKARTKRKSGTSALKRGNSSARELRSPIIRQVLRGHLSLFQELDWNR